MLGYKDQARSQKHHTKLKPKPDTPDRIMKPETPPQGLSPGAYSEEEALRRVFNATLRKPITLGTALLGALGGLGAALFAPGGVATGGIFLGAGLLLGGAAWVRNYFGKRDVYLQDYHSTLHKQFEAARIERLKNLKISLNARENRCQQGKEQVDQLDELFQTIREILMRKLSRGELMYSRFLGMAEGVYLLGLKNLEKIITLIMSVRDIDIAELNAGIEELENPKGESKLNAAQQRSLTALKKRKKLYDDAHADIDILLAQNEEAITTLAETSSTIAHLDTETSSRSTPNLDEAMEMLSAFITRHSGDTDEKISLTLT